jgi:hypothetical protein
VKRVKKEKEWGGEEGTTRVEKSFSRSFPVVHLALLYGIFEIVLDARAVVVCTIGEEDFHVGTLVFVFVDKQFEVLKISSQRLRLMCPFVTSTVKLNPFFL